MCYCVYGYNTMTKYKTKPRSFASFSDALEEALSSVFHKKHYKTASNLEMLIYEVDKGGTEKFIASCPVKVKEAKQRGRKKRM